MIFLSGLQYEILDEFKRSGLTVHEFTVRHLLEPGVGTLSSGRYVSFQKTLVLYNRIFGRDLTFDPIPKLTDVCRAEKDSAPFWFNLKNQLRELEDKNKFYLNSLCKELRINERIKDGIYGAFKGKGTLNNFVTLLRLIGLNFVKVDDKHPNSHFIFKGAFNLIQANLAMYISNCNVSIQHLNHLIFGKCIYINRIFSPCDFPPLSRSFILVLAKMGYYLTEIDPNRNTDYILFNDIKYGYKLS